MGNLNGSKLKISHVSSPFLSSAFCSTVICLFILTISVDPLISFQNARNDHGGVALTPKGHPSVGEYKVLKHPCSNHRRNS